MRNVFGLRLVTLVNSGASINVLCGCTLSDSEAVCSRSGPGCRGECDGQMSVVTAGLNRTTIRSARVQ